MSIPMAEWSGDYHIAAKFRISLAGWTEGSPDLSSDQTTGSPFPNRAKPSFLVHSADAGEGVDPTAGTSS